MITTQFLGATATRGCRVRATDGVNYIVRAYDCGLDTQANHEAIARDLARAEVVCIQSTTTGYKWGLK